MSKSLKNILDPNTLFQKYGADIVRLWVASSNYQEDIRISENIVQQAAEMYKNIRNKFKFMLGNLSDFQFDKHQATTFTFLDQCMLALLSKCMDQCMEAYRQYQFNVVLTSIINFLTIHLSGFYLDMAKDILYCDKKDGLRRRQVQTVIYVIVDALVKLLAPIIPHTAEEIYDHFVGKKLDSVHLEKYEKMPLLKQIDVSKYLNEYEQLCQIRNDVLKALEEKRSSKEIGSSLDAMVTLASDDPDMSAFLQSFDAKTWQQILIVSKVVVANTTKDCVRYNHLYVQVKAYHGIKCQRCWNKVSENEIQEGQLCERCYHVLKGE